MKTTLTKNQTIINILFAVILISVFFACKKDTPNQNSSAGGGTSFTNGVFITNEGPYGSGTGTLSFYSRQNGSVSSDVFQTKNGFVLGNVVQSMEVYNNIGYIIVNNGSKAEVVNPFNCQSLGTISGLTNPRYLDRKSTRLNSSHVSESRMPSSA